MPELPPVDALMKNSLAPSRRYFAVVTALAVLFWGMVFFSRSVPSTSVTEGRRVPDNSARRAADAADARREHQAACEALEQARIAATAAKKEFDNYSSQH